MSDWMGGLTKEREGYCYKSGAYSEQDADKPSHPKLDILYMGLERALHCIKNGHDEELQCTTPAQALLKEAGFIGLFTNARQHLMRKTCAVWLIPIVIPQGKYDWQSAPCHDHVIR